MPFISKNGLAKAVKSTKIRAGAPTTTKPVELVIPAGGTIAFIGWVTDGELVSGNAKWFKTPAGNYFWAGNVEVAPEVDITSAQLSAIIPTLIGTKLATAVESLTKAMAEFNISTPHEKSAFIAQTAHESLGFSVFVENLNYSADALRRVWPTRFTAETALLYARKPEKIANKVYSGRNGNGTEASGDGWKYRGRGIIQITFKNNYRACGTALGLNLVANPELLETPLHAFRSGAWYWNSRNLNPLANTGDFIAITRAINGGINGLTDRQNFYLKAKAALGIV